MNALSDLIGWLIRITATVAIGLSVAIVATVRFVIRYRCAASAARAERATLDAERYGASYWNWYRVDSINGLSIDVWVPSIVPDIILIAAKQTAQRYLKNQFIPTRIVNAYGQLVWYATT